MLNNKYLKTTVGLKGLCEIKSTMRIPHRYTEQTMFLDQWEFYWILQSMSLVVSVHMNEKIPEKQNTHMGVWMIKQFIYHQIVLSFYEGEISELEKCLLGYYSWPYK